jgi:hypothetical protein
MKSCTCCNVHYTAEAWKLLPFVGVQRLTEDDEPLELRNCTACHTTLAIELPGPLRTATIHPVLFARLKPASWHAASLRRFN